jgi:hypothetical protein
MIFVWVLRDIFLVIDIGLYALILGAVASNASNLESKYGLSGSSLGLVEGVAAGVIVLLLISLVVDIFCITKRIRQTLTPKFFLIAQIIQVVVATIFLVLHFLGARTWFSIIVTVAA